MFNYIYVIGGWNNGALAYNEEGILPTGVVESDDKNMRTGIRLIISPNPFSSEVRIQISEIRRQNSEDRGQILLKIYAPNGRLVHLDLNHQRVDRSLLQLLPHPEAHHYLHQVIVDQNHIDILQV